VQVPTELTFEAFYTY